MGSGFSFTATKIMNLLTYNVTKGNADGKIWLEPVLNIAYMHSFNNAEQKNILEIVSSNYELLKNKWYEYFGK